MRNKKYEILYGSDYSKGFRNQVVHRIKALEDFGDVKKGDIGGFVFSEDNLSKYDDCWIYGNAIVAENARVTDDAKVMGNAIISGKAKIVDDVVVRDYAEVSGTAVLSDYATVRDNAIVSDDARVYGEAIVDGRAYVGGHAHVYDNAHISDRACVEGDAYVFNNAVVDCSAHVKNRPGIGHNARITGRTEIDVPAKFFTDAEVSYDNQFLFIGPLGSRNDYTTFYKTSNGGINVACGCFRGSLYEFITRVKKTYRLTNENSRKQRRFYLLAAKYAKKRLK